jgi:glycosyltransferase involved in cell wall biosynthesis
MRIVQLTPSAGDGFYCENCIRDEHIVRSLRAAGHDVTVVPLYLPLQSDAAGPPPEAPVFLGGINVYLQQKWAFFRRTPRWMDRLFDSPRLLKWASRKAAMTAARDLGEMMLSSLRGEEGRQAKEMGRLVEYLASQQRPEVVCLSDALLAGLAREIRRRLGVPVVCWLQDEDGFLDALSEPFRSRAWQELSRRAGDIDAFIATSRYYADVMTRRLLLPPGKVHVVYAGIDAEDYRPASPPDRPAIGFISRMCHSKGLDMLVEAMVQLKRNPALAGLKLRASGGQTAYDKPFLAEIDSRLAAAGIRNDVEYFAPFDRQGRKELLHAVSVLSVPSRQAEASGLYVLEALACGVPVALPGHGAFSEIVEATGGGLLFRPNDPSALAEALAEILLDPAAAREMGRRGRQAVAARFSLRRAGEDFLAICEKVARPDKKSD